MICIIYAGRFHAIRISRKDAKKTKGAKITKGTTKAFFALLVCFASLREIPLQRSHNNLKEVFYETLENEYLQ
jgi:hypothetical protein